MIDIMMTSPTKVHYTDFDDSHAGGSFSVLRITDQDGSTVKVFLPYLTAQAAAEAISEAIKQAQDDVV